MSKKTEEMNKISNLIDKLVKVVYKCPNCKRKAYFSRSEYKKIDSSVDLECCGENMEFDDFEMINNP